ncbi:AMP-binding protein [Nocardia sp. BMG111209]|uniref:AMP-binding protein n=1 Tax=Nocardia sp. BMG111209 TaxID=1160137 RepID=UPI00035DE7DA|nr:AMP-binding protein [Nocardia sp. BMG111209]
MSSHRTIGPDGPHRWRTDSAGPPPESIPRLLDRILATAADHPALPWPADDRMSFGELAGAAGAVAHALAAITKPGARVAIRSTLSPEWVILHYACALSGRIAAPFDPAWTDDEVRQAAELSTPAVAFTGPASTGGTALHGVPARELAALREWAWAAPTAGLPEIRATDPYLIRFTSGARTATVLSQCAALDAARAATGIDVWPNPSPYQRLSDLCHVVLGGLVHAAGAVRSGAGSG